MRKVDTFDGAKPRFLNRGKSAAQYQPLSIPRALVLSAVEGSDRGVEWVDWRPASWWVGSREAGPLGRPAFAEAASRRQAEVTPTPRD